MESVSNSVNYNTTNIFTEKIMYGATYENAELGTAPDGTKTIILHAGGSITFSIPEQDMKSDSKYLKSIIKFEESPATASNYTSPIFAEFKVGYASSEIKDSSFVVVNRDIEISEDTSESTEEQGVVLYENESVIQNRGQYILTLDCGVYNKSEEDFVIRGIELYLSKDASVYQIASVLNSYDVVYTNVMQSIASFNYAQFVQFFQTNIFSMDAMQELVKDRIVNYMTLKDWTMGFYSAELSEETEQFYIDVTVGDKVERIYFWYAIIGDSPEAYKYLTTYSPKDRFPDISDVDLEKFKFKVYKSKSVQKKLSIEFATVSDGKGGKTQAPVFLLGAGTSSDPNSLNGKGAIFKDGGGFYVNYTSQNGVTGGIIMSEDGNYLRNFVNWLDYCQERDNGFDIKFKGDPEFSLTEVRDEANNFLGFEKDGIFMSFPRKAGPVGT